MTSTLLRTAMLLGTAKCGTRWTGTTGGTRILASPPGCMSTQLPGAGVVYCKESDPEYVGEEHDELPGELWSK